VVVVVVRGSLWLIRTVADNSKREGAAVRLERERRREGVCVRVVMFVWLEGSKKILG